MYQPASTHIVIRSPITTRPANWRDAQGKGLKTLFSILLQQGSSILRKYRKCQRPIQRGVRGLVILALLGPFGNALWGSAPAQLAQQDVGRSYYYRPTREEIDRWHTLIKILDNSNVAAVGFKYEKLQVLGDSVDHIHPMGLLLIAFTNEELKASMRNIASRKGAIHLNGKVWKRFVQDMGKSLQKEKDQNNLTEEMICDFSQRVKINPAVIRDPLMKDDWKIFMDRLVECVPRMGDTSRYDG